MGFSDLFKPKWKHSESIVRQEAVKKITNQKILAEISKNEAESFVRKEAVKKITDQKILAKIAKNDAESFVREEAVEKLNWYQGENKSKSVKEVVLNVMNPDPVESKFGMMMLGSKYHMLRSNFWTTSR